MTGMEGLPEFHALLVEHPLVDLVEADVDAFHGEALLMNADHIVEEAFAFWTRSLSDHQVYEAILAAEKESGVYWPDTAPPLPAAPQLRLVAA